MIAPARLAAFDALRSVDDEPVDLGGESPDRRDVQVPERRHDDPLAIRQRL